MTRYGVKFFEIILTSYGFLGFLEVLRGREDAREEHSGRDPSRKFMETERERDWW